VSVLAGDGHGSFQAAQQFATGIHPDALAVAVLTGDGFPDIVTAGVDVVGVLFGNGVTFVPAGLFQPPSPPVAAAPTPISSHSYAASSGLPGAPAAAPLTATPATALPANLTNSLPGSALPSQTPAESTSSATTPSLLLSAVLAVPFNATASSGGGTAVATPSGAEAVDLRVSDLLLAALPDQEAPLELPTEQDVLSGLDIAGSLLTGTRPRANLVVGQGNPVAPFGALVPGEPEDAAGLRNEDGGEEGPEAPLLMHPVKGTLLAPLSVPKALPPLLNRAPAGRAADAVADAVFGYTGEEDPERDILTAARPPAGRQGMGGALVLAAAIGLVSAGLARQKGRGEG
jgi:hypothetical protein